MLIGAARPELHRYCARLTGSVIDGEDVLQDAIERALATIDTIDSATPLRPWLFRIAHNRALDVVRSRVVRASRPLEAAAETADTATPDPLEALMRRDVVKTAVARFLELPATQRSAVILKDVLDYPLEEIATVLDISSNAVKALLARARARLKEIDQREQPILSSRPASEAAEHYARLFNQRDWDGLRALLAADVTLNQATHPRRAGPSDVGRFFSIYARSEAVRLVPAWLEGHEVLAVFEDPAVIPCYFMRVAWRDGRIAAIQDYKYARYVMESAELVLADPAAGGATDPPDQTRGSAATG
jgi:RNA polymerase sigma factor (sigma-70 family)